MYLICAVLRVYTMAHIYIVARIVSAEVLALSGYCTGMTLIPRVRFLVVGVPLRYILPEPRPVTVSSFVTQQSTDPVPYIEHRPVVALMVPASMVPVPVLFSLTVWASPASTKCPCPVAILPSTVWRAVRGQ